MAEVTKEKATAAEKASKLADPVGASIDVATQEMIARANSSASTRSSTARFK